MTRKLTIEEQDFDAILFRLGGMLLNDMNLAGRQMRLDKSNAHGEVPDEFIDKVSGAAGAMSLVYTAFDGDHQFWVPLMRRAVLAEGHVPVNPDSVLDYRETLLSRHTKQRVMLDDLALLRACDELWVFTDNDVSVEGAVNLAEGALAELLFFLKRHRSAAVHFVGVHALAETGVATKKPWPYSYEELRARLPPDLEEGIMGVVNSGYRTDEKLPVVTYLGIDPLDFKYARFLLPWAYGHTERRNGRVVPHAPLVPYLTVCAGDISGSLREVGMIVLSWMALMRVCGELRLFPPLEPGRGVSLIQELWKRSWLRRSVGGPADRYDWDLINIPKLVQRREWALTAREKRLFDIPSDFL